MNFLMDELKLKNVILEQATEPLQKTFTSKLYQGDDSTKYIVGQVLPIHHTVIDFDKIHPTQTIGVNSKDSIQMEYIRLLFNSIEIVLSECASNLDINLVINKDTDKKVWMSSAYIQRISAFYSISQLVDILNFLEPTTIIFIRNNPNSRTKLESGFGIYFLVNTELVFGAVYKFVDCENNSVENLSQINVPMNFLELRDYSHPFYKTVK